WRRPGRVRATLGWALGVGLGFALGCLLVGVSVYSSQWNDSQRLLVVLLPAVVLVGCLAALPPVPRGAARAAPLRPVRAAGARAASAAPVTRPRSSALADPGSAGWTPTEALAWLSGLGAALAAVWVALALLAERRPGRSVPFALALVCAGAGVTILCSHYLTD